MRKEQKQEGERDGGDLREFETNFRRAGEGKWRSDGVVQVKMNNTGD